MKLSGYRKITDSHSTRIVRFFLLHLATRCYSKHITAHHQALCIEHCSSQNFQSGLDCVLQRGFMYYCCIWITASILNYGWRYMRCQCDRGGLPYRFRGGLQANINTWEKYSVIRLICFFCSTLMDDPFHKIEREDGGRKRRRRMHIWFGHNSNIAYRYHIPILFGRVLHRRNNDRSARCRFPSPRSFSLAAKSRNCDNL